MMHHAVMTSQHMKGLVEPTDGFALACEIFGPPRPSAPAVSVARIRAKLQAGRGADLAPEERGLLLALLEEHAPESRGAA